MNLTLLESAQSRGFDEVILLNERGEVAECTSANIFIANGSQVWTPPLSSGCLPGITVNLGEILNSGFTAGQAIKSVTVQGTPDNPGIQWSTFEASCSMRDMGTHLCTLPTGEHCPKGLVCLGCVHAQPKKSAVPVFRRMLASHDRELAAAKVRGEPAGQLAARELEVVRIKSALQRAEDLTDDVAAAIEAAAGPIPDISQS
jgi:hypothetical protein